MESSFPLLSFSSSTFNPLKIISLSFQNICFKSIYFTHLHSYNIILSHCHLSPEILQNLFNSSLDFYPWPSSIRSPPAIGSLSSICRIKNPRSGQCDLPPGLRFLGTEWGQGKGPPLSQTRGVFNLFLHFPRGLACGLCLMISCESSSQGVFLRLQRKN